jgi:hypothetical protein
MPRRRAPAEDPPSAPLKLLLLPCSCGATFAAAADYHLHGGSWHRFLVCPGCGKRHDPRNRLLELGYHREGYWAVNGC